jgi:hypothetical protein
VTDESETPAQKPELGTLVPGKYGGLIWRGKAANHVPGPGRPREAIRATMRQHLDEEVIAGVLEEWREGKITALQVAELFGKYGLGTQTEAVAPEDIKAEANRMLAELCRILMDEEHWPTAKVQRVVERMVEAGQHPQEG